MLHTLICATDEGFEVNESMLEFTAEIAPPKDFSASAAVAAVGKIQQPATQLPTDSDYNFDLVMFGTEAGEAEKADSAQPLAQLTNQTSDGHISSKAAAHQPQSVDPIQGNETKSAQVCGPRLRQKGHRIQICIVQMAKHKELQRQARMIILSLQEHRQPCLACQSSVSRRVR